MQEIRYQNAGMLIVNVLRKYRRLARMSPSWLPEMQALPGQIIFKYRVTAKRCGSFCTVSV
ncbi:MAG: hypothetical protein EPGJADBJ_04812 [Saprospiraceae bacterium]|nr:hypothetical protein [Saprospiraceae bacterium]